MARVRVRAHSVARVQPTALAHYKYGNLHFEFLLGIFNSKKISKICFKSVSDQCPTVAWVQIKYVAMATVTWLQVIVHKIQHL